MNQYFGIAVYTYAFASQSEKRKDLQISALPSKRLKLVILHNKLHMNFILCLAIGTINAKAEKYLESRLLQTKTFRINARSAVLNAH